MRRGRQSGSRRGARHPRGKHGGAQDRRARQLTSVSQRANKSNRFSGASSGVRVGQRLAPVKGLPPKPGELLQFDAGAGRLELGLGLVGLLLGDLLQDRLGGAVDQVLGLLQAEAGQGADLLDDLDLLLAGAGDDDVELVLLLDLGGGIGAAATGRGGGGTGAAAVTPNFSSNSFSSSDSSRTVMLAMESRISALVAMVVIAPYRGKGWVGQLAGGVSRSGAVAPAGRRLVALAVHSIRPLRWSWRGVGGVISRASEVEASGVEASAVEASGVGSTSAGSASATSAAAGSSASGSGCGQAGSETASVTDADTADAAGSETAVAASDGSAGAPPTRRARTPQGGLRGSEAVADTAASAVQPRSASDGCRRGGGIGRRGQIRVLGLTHIPPGRLAASR